MRLIEPPVAVLPLAFEVSCGRWPFTVTEERTIIGVTRVDNVSL